MIERIDMVNYSVPEDFFDPVDLGDTRITALYAYVRHGLIPNVKTADYSSLLNTFFNTPRSLLMMSVILDNPNNQKGIIRDLCGDLFQGLAYEGVRSHFAQNDQILLSPEETLYMFRKLNPQSLVSTQKFGLNRSLMGISVPDGLVFKQQTKTLRLVNILEYTMSRPPERDIILDKRFRHVKNQLRQLKENRTKVSLISQPRQPQRISSWGSAELVTVIPSDYPSPSIDHTLILPVSSGQIVAVVKKIVSRANEIN